MSIFEKALYPKYMEQQQRRKHMKNTSYVRGKESDRTQTSRQTRTLVETALLIAITLIMGLTPLGTIRTPFLSVSLVTVPVAIAGMMVGPTCSLICGTVFGITSFINALTGTSGLLSTLFTINPFGVFVTAVIARMLMGVLCGLIFKGLHRIHGLRTASYYIGAVSAPILNTVFFMSSLILFFYHTDYIQGMVKQFGVTNPFAFVLALVGVQGLIEAVACLAIAGTIGLVLAKALQRN